MVAHGRQKQARLGDSAVAQPKTPNFSNGRDIHAFFWTSSQNVPIDGLKTLRNQLSLKPGEDSVSTQDARLILVKEWLETSPGAQDVFGVLEKGPQPTTTALCVSILSCLLTLTSLHFVYQTLGQPIVKKLLTAQRMRRLDSYLSGAHSDLCLAALKLLNAISKFAGGKEQKCLLESFSWDVKVFHKLLYMRRKGKDGEHDILARPDIRTLSMFLEQHRDIFLSIFKGLNADPHLVVRYVLEVLWTNLWQDQKVKRTLKVGLFGETTVQHLLKLYERSAQEGSDPEHVPADVVHHFLLAICTHRGVGICFADNGWYPRRDADAETNQKGGKFHNKILANTLKTLKVNDDARQQELALKVLRACPELVAGYLSSTGLTLEPRLSSKWLANIAFLGAIVSLPVPVESFFLPTGTAGSSSAPARYTYQPTPPPLATVVENVLPSASLKVHLSKALQAPSALVQHAAGLALAQCMHKCEKVLDAFRTVEQALEEDESDGQWARRRVEVEREVRRRAPDFQVIIAFSNTYRSRGGAGGIPPSTKSAMLSELAQRLLWLYHRCVPSLVAEARYDVGKSLQTFPDQESCGSDMPTETEGLHRLQQLHVLKMLKESDQFVWFAKAAPSAPSNIHILLKLFFQTTHGAIREALTSLLTHALRDSLLFQHDHEELHLWLDALPSTVRSPGVESPDDAPLTDERESVVAFLDECMQRCAKTPHRYLEELDVLVTVDLCRSTNASPVVVTVLEQLSAKMRSSLLTPSDALALTTYVRKVVVSLLGKQPDLVLCQSIAARLATIVIGDDVFPKYPVIAAALRKEVEILDACISRCSFEPRTADDQMETSPSSAVQTFVEHVEQIENQSGSAVAQAYELVDWLRLVDQFLNSEIINRLAAVVKRLHPPALSTFYLHLNPETNLLCASEREELVAWVPVDWLLLHASSEQLRSTHFSSILSDALGTSRKSLYTYKRFCGIAIHRLVLGSFTDVGCILDTLTHLIACAKAELASQEFFVLKSFVLVERQNIRLLSCADDLPASAHPALRRLLDLMIDHTEYTDRSLVSSICKHWIATISNSINKTPGKNISGLLVWIKFMAFEDLLDITGQVLRSLQSCENSDVAATDGEMLNLVEELLSSLVHYEGKLVSGWLNEHLSAFLSLRQLLPTVNVLERVIARSVNGLPIPSDESAIKSVVDEAQLHWASRLSSLPRDASSAWSRDTAVAVASFIYRSSVARNHFWTWLALGDLSEKPALDRLAPAIHAYFDSSFDEEFNATSDGDLVKTLFSSLAKQFFNRPAKDRDTQVLMMCLIKIMKRCSTRRSDFVKTLVKWTSTLSVDILHQEALHMTPILDEICGGDIDPFVEAITSHALQWAVRHLSDNADTTDIDEASLDDLIEVLYLGKGIITHFSEPVIAAAIRQHLRHPRVMYLAEVLFSKISLKPANVNRHLQSILQHAHFNQSSTSDVAIEEKGAVVNLLFKMFRAYPANTCQPSHIQPLIHLYSGTLSSPDRQLFAIFRLFETQRKTSVASIFAQWSQLGSSSQLSSLDAISNLDANCLLRTCLNLPDRRTLAVDNEEEVTVSRVEDGLIYDPVFVLLLFAQALIESPPRSALSWVSLYRTNVVSLVIRCMSSADVAVRQLASLQLGLLWKLMQTADMQEKGHVIHLLDLLRDQLPEMSEISDEPPIRLASYTTLLLAHALRGIFYPSNFIYPITARFLLQRPELDVHDVPMLYGLLYSSSGDWKKERAWMVRFLADGMLSSEDWRLLKRRHTWDLLASLFQGSFNDRTLRHGILEVLANLTSHSQATTSLVLKSSLIQWIEMQLLIVKTDESIAWAKIIENILVVVDSGKIEQATKGEWQTGLLRCLTKLLYDADILLLRLIARSMSRLSSGRLHHSPSLSDALELALERLIKYEKSSALSLAGHRYRACASREALPPHRSQRLHQLPFKDNLASWGSIVEGLWSVAIRHGVSEDFCGQLSARLLLWRTACGSSGSRVGEWAREQAVTLLKDQAS
ncbi:ribosome 60S biogenesis N-terminal-domain-containing protein [Phellopilus nigrolimitatus]|nr:ribosome 60S biogenesis N-terminal-domain-containing protein [Phellopilus nigrolimitatus]